jgi:hypothetical protein
MSPYSSQAEYNSALYALSRIVACNTSDFGTLRMALETVLNNTIQAGCQSIDQLCLLPRVVQSSSTVGDCTTQGPCTTTLLQDYATGQRGAQTFHDILYQCSVGGNMITTVENPQSCDNPSSFNISRDVQMPLSQCPSSCANQLLQLTTNTILTVANSTTVFRRILDRQIFPLLDCYFVVQAFQATETIVCQDFNSGLQLVAAGSVIYGFMLMVCLLIGCFCVLTHFIFFSSDMFLLFSQRRPLQSLFGDGTTLPKCENVLILAIHFIQSVD